MRASRSQHPVRARSWTRHWSRLALPAAATVVLSAISVPVVSAADPTLRILDVSVKERDTVGLVAKVQVRLSTAPTGTISVDFATSPGSATSPADFATTSGTLTWLPGDGTAKIALVPIVGDLRPEKTETFRVVLRDPSNARIADGIAVVRILDDDALPKITIRDIVVDEGNAGATAGVIRVALSGSSRSRVSVRYRIVDGTAYKGFDYSVGQVAGTLTFPPGTVVGKVRFSVIGDRLDEPNETFAVRLSRPVNATIADASGAVVIRDNDGPRISISDTSVEPGTAAIFTVTLSDPSPQTVRVAYATEDGTATQPQDYVATSGTVEFSPGQQETSVSVTTKSDADVGGEDQGFRLVLSDPVGASLSDASGAANIDGNHVKAKARSLPDVSGDTDDGDVDVQRSSTIIAGGDVDWYRFKMTEDNTAISSEQLSATVSLEVEEGGGNLDLRVHTEGVQTSENPGTADESVVVTEGDAFASWDDEDVWIEVYSPGGEGNAYTLRIEGDTH